MGRSLGFIEVSFSYDTLAEPILSGLTVRFEAVKKTAYRGGAENAEDITDSFPGSYVPASVASEPLR